MRPTHGGSTPDPETPPAPAEQQPRPIRVIPARRLPQAVIPIAIQTDPDEYVEEKIEDLRERRHQRRDDRASNHIGTAGLAINGTALLLVLSGALFSSQMTAYSWFMAILSIPLVMVGIPCAIIGGLRVGRVRYLAWIGVGLGALLVLILIPALMLLLLGRK